MRQTPLRHTSPALLVLIVAACTAVRGPATPSPTGTPAATRTATLWPSPTPLPTWTPIPTPMPGGLYVDAAPTLGPASRYSLGTNCSPWMAVPFELMPQFRDSGLTLLRFPGGNWGDNNNLLAYHIDSLIAQVNEIHAEPLVCVRLRNGSPERAAEVVRLCSEKGLRVRYWSIGNEPNLYASRGYADYDTVRFNREWRRFALAMKAVDPGIRLVGPDISQFTGEATVDPKDAAGHDWLREFLRANGDLVDVVSVHRYPFPKRVGAGPPTRTELLADASRWDGIVRNLRAAVREETGRDLPVAVTEFNSSWVGTAGGDTTLDSFLNALWLADVLGRLMRQGTFMVAHFALQTGPGGGGFGLLGGSEVRPSYYVYQMYKRFGSQLVYASSDSPTLSIYAAQQPDGTLTLLVVNLGEETVHRPVRLDHFAPQGQAGVYLFDASHPAAELARVPVTVTFEHEFPALSVTLLSIPGQVRLAQ